MKTFRLRVLPRLFTSMIATFIFSQWEVIAACHSAESPDARIERLIDRLAAKSPQPPRGTTVMAPREKDIWQAVDSLTELGVEAFPQLIGHFDDERFSYSEKSLSAFRPVAYQQTVGDLCREIVESQVQKFVPWNVGDPRGTPGSTWRIIPQSKREAESWWQANCKKELWELQADNVRSVIAANQEQLKTENNPRRREFCEEAIRANEKLLSKLTRKQTPRRTKPFRPTSG